MPLPDSFWDDYILPEGYTFNGEHAIKYTPVAQFIATETSDGDKSSFLPLIRFPITTPESDEDGDLWLPGCFNTPKEAIQVLENWIAQYTPNAKAEMAYIEGWLTGSVKEKQPAIRDLER